MRARKPYQLAAINKVSKAMQVCVSGTHWAHLRVKGEPYGCPSLMDRLMTKLHCYDHAVNDAAETAIQRHEIIFEGPQ